MELKELRIGNLANYNGITVTIAEIRADNKFRFISKKLKISGVFPLENLTPIQLSEKWLVDFGFEKIDGRINETYRKDIGAFYFQIVLMNNGKAFNVRLANHDFEESPEIVGLGMIFHVHSLQNIWHSITCSELQLSSKDGENK